jgi:hypothetical protein
VVAGIRDERGQGAEGADRIGEGPAKCEGRKTMNASKENCRKAIKCLERIGRQTAVAAENPEDYKFVRDFLESAKRKLPGEASYAKAQRSKLKAHS